ncbi:hypothetical protein A8C32_11575 [Flavivirga aquatica]|uniref:Uncharacterized protein n=1 Tax=Flavivirga aquatica TaxID=1849968 RepID=A0A1E5TD94_9FLAO|nr:hypothetical protein A8C32_11575 [Flavivirga aquatica]
MPANIIHIVLIRKKINIIITYMLPICYPYVAKLNMKEMEIISHISIVKRGSETLVPTLN